MRGTLPYTVVRGDTLIGIAERYFVTGADPDVLAEVVKLNELRNPNRIAPGTVLQLPAVLFRIEPLAVRVERIYGKAEASIGKLTPEASLSVGDSIRTGDDGGVVLRLPDGSRLWVREDSEMRIETLQRRPAFDQEESVFQVLRGRVESIVNKLRGPSRYEIRTPVATTGVRGTEFRLNVASGGGPSRVEVLEGAVGAQSATVAQSPEVALNEGFGSVVEANAPPLPPIRLLPAPDTGGLPTLQERPLVRFQPKPIEGAVGYRAEVLRPEDGTVAATASFKTPDLRFAGLDDGDYSLRFRGVDDRALEGRDALHAFTLKARPEPPAPTSPPDRAKSSGGRIELAWAQVPEAQNYRLQIARDPALKDVVVDERRLARPGHALDLAPGDYYWRLATVRAGDDQGPFGDVRRFTLRPLPKDPDPPSVAPGGLSLSWAGEPGQTYELQLAREPKFERIEASHRLAEPRIDLPLPRPGKSYFRVRATDPDGFVGPFTTPQIIEIPPEPMPAWLLFVPLLFLLLL